MTDPRDLADAGGSSSSLCHAEPHPRYPGTRLVGELDLSTRPVLLDALAGLDEEPGEVWVDVSDLEFVDVGAVFELVRFVRRRHPRRVTIESPSRLLLRIVDVLFADTDLHLA